MTDPKVSVLDSLPDGLLLGDDGGTRCRWAAKVPEFLNYHDTEWGFPVDDDHTLFEKICLEGFQSGLSWRTILNKRPAFREVFLNFDFEQVARFDNSDVQRLLGDARIVRHRGKIEATISNAQRACDAVKTHGSLGALIWRYEPPLVAKSTHETRQVISKTTDSAKLAADLRKLGWRFFGPTTAYAFMQAMGLVNDHVVGCAIRKTCEAARIAFERPSPIR
jgi:DNA-3-methyladenine glycosylase I